MIIDRSRRCDNMLIDALINKCWYRVKALLSAGLSCYAMLTSLHKHRLKYECMHMWLYNLNKPHGYKYHLKCCLCNQSIGPSRNYFPILDTIATPYIYIYTLIISVYDSWWWCEVQKRRHQLCPNLWFLGQIPVMLSDKTERMNENLYYYYREIQKGGWSRWPIMTAYAEKSIHKCSAA